MAILGGGWDFLLLGPGATLLVSAAFVILSVTGAIAAASGLATVLSLLLVGPHYAATYRRAYGSAAIVRAHPAVTVVAPVLLGGGAVAAVRWPTSVGLLYFLTYVVWTGYHYSGQSLGLAMLYPLRQGARLDAREKRLLSLPLYASWLVSLVGLLRVEGSARNPAYQVVRDAFAGARLPGWALAAGLALLLASLAGPAAVVRARRRAGAPLPPASLAVVGAQVCWFGVGLFFPFFNIVLVPIFHGLQYLALTGWHHQRPAGGHGTPGLRRFAAYVVAVMVLGLLINPGMLLLPGLLPLSPEIAGRTLVMGAAVITFVNLHHFLLDGRIWRLRERRLGQSMLA